MKKANPVLPIILILLYSCNNSVHVQNEETNKILKCNLNKVIDSIAKKFIDSAKCSECIHELYIDKVYDDKTIFTFKSFSPYSEYFVKNNPQLMTDIDNTKLYIYTGAETFLKESINKSTLKNSYTPLDKINYLSLQYVFENKEMKLLEYSIGPFFPMPKQPPLINDSTKFDPSKFSSNK
jgi:hypothetical protein